MKLALALLLAIAGTLSVQGIPINDVSHRSSIFLKGLEQDLNDFLTLVPTKKIEEIVLEYLANDEDFQGAVEYMLSEEFKSLVLEVEAIEDVKVFVKYLSESGLDVYTVVNQIHAFLGLEHIAPPMRIFGTRITGGLPGLIADIKAILPVDKIESLYTEKLETSEDFAALVQRLGSPEFQKIVDTVWANEKLQELISRAEAKGVDVKAILQLITDILGIHFPSRHARSITRGLVEDLEDFLALVPTEKVEEIVLEYLANDEDFQGAVEYMLSEEFKSLVLEVEAIEDVKVFVKYLSESGLDVYTIVNQIHDFLGLEHIAPPMRIFGTRITGGLPGLIADIKAILPVDKIESLYTEKLETSENFAALVQRLGSPEFQKIVDTVWANEKLQELISRAEAKGVDVKAILQLITDILGIHFPSRHARSITRGLVEDLEDFLALVPTEKVEEIVLEYLANDEDFQGAVEYMLSEEFKSLVLEVEAIEDVKVFVKYLSESGLDVYTILNKVHEFLGLEPIVPPMRIFGMRITEGLPGLIADIKAILPVDKIEALYKEKLETSEDFAALVQRLGSPEFQKIVDTVWANEKLQELISRAEAKGVDVEAILQLITDILGIHFPAPQFFLMTKLHQNRERNLKDDLNDLLALIPTDEVLDLALEYVAVDEDFQVALEYVLSDYFGGLILDIESIEGVPEFLEYLSGVGLDVYNFLNSLHEIWGHAPIAPPMRVLMSTRITGGLPGFIEDVKAILPLEEIKALYQDKSENSQPLKDLLQRIQTPEFQIMVDVLMSNEKLNDLMDKAEGRGINVNAILEGISKLLGIKLPSRPASAPRSTALVNNDLIDDLRDIADLVPTKKITAIVLRYAAVDKDFKRVVRYMLSNEFHTLIKDAEATTELKELLEYLNDVGLDVYKWIKIFHKVIHIADLEGRRSLYVTGGISGLIEDIRAVLPLEELYALYDEKLENSPAFVEFVDRLRSQKLQNLINALAANNEVQRILTTLESMGVDVDNIFKLLSDFFGIIFPERPLY